MKFEKSKVYNFRWPDGAIAEYTVTGIDKTTVYIMFANGAENRFQIGSNMYKFSWPKGQLTVDKLA